MTLKIFRYILFLTVILYIQGCEEIIPKPPQITNPDDGNTGNDNTPVTGIYAECLNVLSTNTLDVVSWNIEQFSSSNTNTTTLSEIIAVMDADIIGVQEITSISDFNAMVATIDGWEAMISSSGGGLNTGYLYKISEITINGGLSTIYNDNSSAFPRPPVIGNFTHISGTQFTIINLHLKCCGGSTNEARRREAAELLKVYIDANLASVPVLVVGDYNDEIQEAGSANVFKSFLDDASNYRFADMAIATGEDSDWSFPSWPSHLDHILMTNELFDRWESTSTLKIDNCRDSYEAAVSDHRPVMARYKMD